MNRAVIVHGKPSKEKCYRPDYPGPSRANWLRWAAEQLLADGFERVSNPEVSEPYNPSYRRWTAKLDREEIGNDTLVIGHSFGVAALVNYIAARPGLRVGQIIGVAPWFDPNWRYPFAGVPNIPDGLVDRTVHGVDILFSHRDGAEVQQSIDMLYGTVPDARFRDLPEYGHFLIGNTMTSAEFPELLQTVARTQQSS